mgnify:CR=1 FL=1
MRIPGIPGASEPAFRTRDARWMGLDAVVQETVAVLKEEGFEVSLMAAKATIQIARFVVQEPVERDTEALLAAVNERLRARCVLLPTELVREVLATYTQVIVVLDVLEINEFG